MFDVIVLFYSSLPGLSNIKLCTVVDRERFSVFRVDHQVLKCGHPWYSLHACSCCSLPALFLKTEEILE
jgi:hypothetical protein